jgi:hypothetical protein
MHNVSLAVYELYALLQARSIQLSLDSNQTLRVKAYAKQTAAPVHKGEPAGRDRPLGK